MTRIGVLTGGGDVPGLNPCIRTLVYAAADRGYEVVVPSDCVGSYFDEFQRVGLDMVAAQGGIFGWVTDSSALICLSASARCSAVRLGLSPATRAAIRSSSGWKTGKARPSLSPVTGSRPEPIRSWSCCGVT